MNDVAYGIDFGTSNSAIVVARSDGTLAQVRDPGSPIGLSSVPTSVCVLRDGRLMVGRAAENAKRLRPAAFRSDFKRDFGDETPVRLDDREFRPDELTTEVLRFLREQAIEQVPGTANRVVITVPAAWESGKHALMLKAAERAGFDPGVVELVAEPVAALAYAFGSHASAGSETVLVYDLGGGTFDCALAQGNEAGYEILGAPGGLGDIGGTLFDRMLLQLMRARYGDSVAALLDGPPADPDTMRRRLSLKDTCEAFKCQLSVAETHEDLLSELVPPVTFELTRAALEEELRPLLEETLAECDRLVTRNNLTWQDIDQIIPVGGSSRIPLVGRMLAEHSLRVVLRVEDPDLAIARGAARMAHDLEGFHAMPAEEQELRNRIRRYIVQQQADYPSLTKALNAARVLLRTRTPEARSGNPKTDAWPYLQPVTDSRKRMLKSGHSIQNTWIEFINDTSMLIWVFWLDYDGNIRLYCSIASEQGCILETFLTHPWMVGTQDGQVWGPYLPERHPTRALITEAQ